MVQAEVFQFSFLFLSSSSVFQLGFGSVQTIFKCHNIAKPYPLPAMLTKMRHITILIFLLFSLTIANGQTTATLIKLIKSEADATDCQKEINRLQKLLTQKFLTKANNKKEKTHKQIQDFFSDFKLNDINLSHYNYPAKLDKTNLTISIIGYDNNWGLLPKSGDTSLLEGYGNQKLNAIITIPIFDSYNRGYSLNSITFFCILTENIYWTQKQNIYLPIEKLPSYSKEVEIEIKLLDLDK